MKIVKWISALGLLAMPLVLWQGFTLGSFTQDGGALLQNPWGLVSVVDLYVGFALFAMWIYFREASHLQAVLWIVVLMILGFHLASLYVLIQAFISKGDWLTFFLGARKTDLIQAEKSSQAGVKE